MMNYIQKMKKKITLTILPALAVVLVGCGGGGGENPSIAGISGPDVNIVNGYFILSMTFRHIHFDGGVTIPIKNYPNSSISVGPDFESDGMLLTFNIAIEDFVEKENIEMNPQSLPGGRPLPSVADGALPAIAITVPELNDTIFYVGNKIFGVFVPFKMDFLGVTITHRFYDVMGIRAGNISLVNSDAEGENGGLLVLINVDKRIQKQINKHMNSIR